MSRPKKNPDFNAAEQMRFVLTSVSGAYNEGVSLCSLAAELDMTPLKVRKLLITVGVYSAEISDKVNRLHEAGMNIAEIMEQTDLSRASVHSYLPYTKGIYNMRELSLDAQRCQLYRERKTAVEILKVNPSEENLWVAVTAFRDYPFHTSSGLTFRYTLKVGRGGEWRKELWIDRRENSKSLSWSSFMRAYRNALSMRGQEVPGLKSLGNIRGVSYIYPILWRIGVITVPEVI